MMSGLTLPHPQGSHLCPRACSLWPQQSLYHLYFINFFHNSCIALEFTLVAFLNNIICVVFPHFVLKVCNIFTKIYHVIWAATVHDCPSSVKIPKNKAFDSCIYCSLHLYVTLFITVECFILRLLNTQLSHMKHITLSFYSIAVRLLPSLLFGHLSLIIYSGKWHV